MILGESAGDHVGIRVKRRTHPQAADYWDGNWVDAGISVVLRPWRGSYEASLRTDEFARFREELAGLDDRNGGAAT